jgi:hypothetical protein
MDAGVSSCARGDDKGPAYHADLSPIIATLKVDGSSLPEAVEDAAQQSNQLLHRSTLIKEAGIAAM